MFCPNKKKEERISFPEEDAFLPWPKIRLYSM